MILDPIEIQSKNNRTFTLRSPEPSEAQDILNLMITVASASPYILSTPEQFQKMKIEDETKWIENLRSNPCAAIIGLYYQSEIIGLASAQSYKDSKRSHRASLGISILPQYQGLGLGLKTMEALLVQMRQFPNIQLIELDVMTENKPAITIYKKLGFQEAGFYPGAYIQSSGEVNGNLMMFRSV